MKLDERTVEIALNLLGVRDDPKGLRNLIRYTNLAAWWLFENEVVGEDNLKVFVGEEDRAIFVEMSHVKGFDTHYVGRVIYNYLLNAFGGDLKKAYENVPRFLARRDLLERGPTTKCMIERSPVLLMEEDARRNPQQYAYDMLAATIRLGKGKNVCICPQGRRYDRKNPPRKANGEIDTKLNHCIDRLAWIAHNVPGSKKPIILPIHVEGLEGLTAEDAKHHKSRVVTTIIGEPFEIESDFKPTVVGLDYIISYRARAQHHGDYVAESGKIFQPVENLMRD